MIEHEPDAIDVIKTVMMRREINIGKASALCGITPGTLGQVLLRKRRLTLCTASALHRGLNVPADVLLQPTHDANGKVWAYNWVSERSVGNFGKGKK